MDAEARRAALRLFTYGLYALTVPDGDHGHAATVNWCTQSSFEPPMVAVSIEKNSRSLQLLRAAGVFAINVLAAGQRDLAGQLGRRSANRPDKFQGVPWEPGTTGAPLLRDALGYVECRLAGELDSGDSVLAVGEVVAAGTMKTGVPLTMQAAGFRHAG